MSWVDTIVQVLAALGAFIVGAGAIVGAVWWLFKLFADKWLNAKFEQRLAAYKHEQQKELEGLKFRISTLMDRTVKLHQREFDVLPEAWGRLMDAYKNTQALISRYKDYPNLEDMNDAHLREFLEKTLLMQWQKAELLSDETKNKNDYYQNAIVWPRLTDARRQSRESHVYLTKNGIFIPPAIKAKFAELDELIFSALVEYEFNERYKIVPRETKAETALNEKGAPIVKTLEEDVQGRLWNSQALDA